VSALRENIWQPVVDPALHQLRVEQGRRGGGGAKKNNSSSRINFLPVTDAQNQHDEPIILQETDKAVVSSAVLAELA
jgi:hypothetical protein